MCTASGLIQSQRSLWAFYIPGIKYVNGFISAPLFFLMRNNHDMYFFVEPQPPTITG